MTMTEREIEAKATTLEKGSAGAMASELHKMSPEDRLAVAKQIAWDQKQKRIPNLPTLVFTDSGELKTAEIQSAPDTKTIENFDTSTGVRKSLDSFNDNGNHVHQEFNKNSGTIKSEDSYRVGQGLMNMPFLETTHKEYEDGFTKVWDEITAKGHRHLEMKRGTKVSEEEKDFLGNKERSKYDANGKLQTVEKIDKDNTKETATYDINGQQTSYDVTYRDKTSVHVELDPKTGDIKSVVITCPPKPTVHWKPGDSNGTLRSHDNGDLGLKFGDDYSVYFQREKGPDGTTRIKHLSLSKARHYLPPLDLVPAV